MHDANAGSRLLQSSARRGFTLVEVIVVMGIVAMLMGLLLPAADMVRQRAWEAQCQSNLRQIGVAIEVYRQNNNRNLPRAAPLPSGDPFNPPDGLLGALGKIMEPESSAWMCPADHDHGSEVIGTSYFYVAGAFMLFQPPDPFPAARQITKFFDEAGSSIPIVWDSTDRHPLGHDLPRNGLYIDGRSDRVGEPFAMPGGEVD